MISKGPWKILLVEALTLTSCSLDYSQIKPGGVLVPKWFTLDDLDPNLLMAKMIQEPRLGVKENYGVVGEEIFASFDFLIAKLPFWAGF
jgi:hypothetical protein